MFSIQSIGLLLTTLSCTCNYNCIHAIKFQIKATNYFHPIHDKMLYNGVGVVKILIFTPPLPKKCWNPSFSLQNTLGINVSSKIT